MLLAILNLAEAINCPHYSCKKDYSSDQPCIQYYTNNTYSLHQCLNNSEYCPLQTDQQDVYCQQSQPTSLQNLYPGQKCSSNANCHSQSCVKGKCSGKQQGQLCGFSIECDVGLNCYLDSCQKQLPIGASGCLTDYDCVNNAGCRLSASGNVNDNICIEYQSLQTGSILTECNYFSNLLCESMQCNNYFGVNVCVESPQSLSLPQQCQTDDDCYSKDGFNKSFCTCSLSSDGLSYCYPLGGDQPWQEMFQQMKEVQSKKDYLDKCHTMIRHDLSCVQMALDKSDYEKYVMTYTQAYNYTSLIQIVPCAEQMFLQEYYEYKNDSFARSIAVLGLIYLIFQQNLGNYIISVKLDGNLPMKLFALPVHHPELLVSITSIMSPLQKERIINYKLLKSQVAYTQKSD